MSYFKTELPVELAGLQKLLPADASIQRVTWDERERRLFVEWHSEELATPYTFAYEFPLESLRKKKLPKNVSVRERKRAPLPQLAVDGSATTGK